MWDEAALHRSESPHSNLYKQTCRQLEQFLGMTDQRPTGLWFVAKYVFPSDGHRSHINERHIVATDTGRAPSMLRHTRQLIYIDRPFSCCCLVLVEVESQVFVILKSCYIL